MRFLIAVVVQREQNLLLPAQNLWHSFILGPIRNKKDASISPGTQERLWRVMPTTSEDK